MIGVLSYMPAQAADRPLNKEGFWRVGADDDVCIASIEIEGGATIVFSGTDGGVSFAVAGKKSLRPGRKGVMSTEAYAFNFTPEYSEDRDYLYVDDVLNDRALAALRLATVLRFDVDGRLVAGADLTDTGFEGALDALIECSKGRSGWWGEGAKDGGDSEQRAAQYEPKGDGTGTGFFISAEGLAVTAAHVVKGCKRVESPRWGDVRVLAADERADLAVLKAPAASGQFLLLRARGPRLGEAVSAAGYPFGQSLGSGLKITTGVVSGLSGLEGDRGYFQLSAPIQPGNSGGPVIDAEGALIGVTAAKLNELAVAKATGQFPQNVNFAVPVTILQSFLEENGVAYKTATGPQATTPAMPGYTFNLVCRR